MAEDVEYATQRVPKTGNRQESRKPGTRVGGIYFPQTKSEWVGDIETKTFESSGKMAAHRGSCH